MTPKRSERPTGGGGAGLEMGRLPAFTVEDKAPWAPLADEAA